jgi:hypothetical protein
MLMQPEAAAMPKQLFQVKLDNRQLHDPGSIDYVMNFLPPAITNGQRGSDIQIIVTKCIANALMHGHASMLTTKAVLRLDKLFLTFTHNPPLPLTAQQALERSRRGWLPDYDDPDYDGFGLGYPIMVRLAARIEISSDRNIIRLHINL